MLLSHPSQVRALDLSGIDANSVDAANSVFLWDGEVASGAHARGHLGFRYETVGGIQHTIVEGNTNNTLAGHNFEIDLIGHIVFTTGADLIL